MGLDGPSRRITVTPVKEPAVEPIGPSEEPERERVPAGPPEREEPDGD